jgi:hypothetical protein
MSTSSLDHPIDNCVHELDSDTILNSEIEYLRSADFISDLLNNTLESCDLSEDSSSEMFPFSFDFESEDAAFDIVTILDSFDEEDLLDIAFNIYKFYKSMLIIPEPERAEVCIRFDKIISNFEKHIEVSSGQKCNLIEAVFLKLLSAYT